MPPKRLRIEQGPGFQMVVCPCGWREMVFTAAGVDRAVHDHRTLYHGDTRGAIEFVSKRKGRATK